MYGLVRDGFWVETLSGQLYIRWFAVAAFVFAVAVNLNFHIADCASLTDRVLTSARGNVQSDFDSTQALKSPDVYAVAGGDYAPPHFAIGCSSLAAVVVLPRPVDFAPSATFPGRVETDIANTPLAHKATSVLLI